MDFNSVQNVAPQLFNNSQSIQNKVNTPVVAPTPAVKVEAPVASENLRKQENENNSNDSRRQAQLMEAAQMFKDVFAVSDQTFSIFKDFNGQYVTRFTSLKDGKITYIPEPDVLEYLRKKQATMRQNMVEIQA